MAKTNLILAFAFLLLQVTCESKEEIGKTVPSQSGRVFSGVVAGETGHLFSISEKGPIWVILNSTKGDADLYAASARTPTAYDFDLHSATCGPDAILIPGSMPRPVRVLIYGYYSHPESSYVETIPLEGCDVDTDEE
eukprot:Colp12_sorted_trinity150504_noHs@4336